jgi:hypothetical protein
MTLIFCRLIRHIISDLNITDLLDENRKGGGAYFKYGVDPKIPSVGFLAPNFKETVSGISN